MEKHTINVKGMHCKSCEMLTEDTLSEIEGITKSKASFDKGIVEVWLEKDKLKDAKKAIAELGYKVL